MQRERERKERTRWSRQKKTISRKHTHTSGIRERKTQPELHACENKKKKKKSKNVRMDHSMRTRLFFITGRVHACVRALSLFCRRRSFGHTDTLGTKQFGVRRVLCRCPVAGCSHSLSVKVAGVEGVGGRGCTSGEGKRSGVQRAVCNHLPQLRAESDGEGTLHFDERRRNKMWSLGRASLSSGLYAFLCCFFP